MRLRAKGVLDFASETPGYPPFHGQYIKGGKMTKAFKREIFRTCDWPTGNNINFYFCLLSPRPRPVQTQISMFVECECAAGAGQSTKRLLNSESMQPARHYFMVRRATAALHAAFLSFSFRSVLCMTHDPTR